MKQTILFHVNTFLAGGIEKVLIDLLQSLDPERYNIKLTIGYDLGRFETLKPQLPPHVAVHYILDKDWLVSAMRKKKTAKISIPEKLLSELFLPPFKKMVHKRKLRELIADVDVVIDFDMTLGAYHSVFKGKRTIAYCHFSFAHYWNGNKRKLNKLADRLYEYDKVIMLCDEMKEDADRMYPRLKTKTVRLYNALNMEKIRTLAEADLGAYSYLEQEPFFVSAGRLEESQKDFTTLIKAFAICAREHHIRQKLVIVGDGGHRPMLEALALTEGVADRIVFAGFDKNPYRWMRRGEVFVFSSKFEGLPTVLIEALSLRKPLVATACPTGIREILMQGKAGILTPVGDAPALAAALVQIQDKSLQQTFLANAGALIPEFDIKHMIRQFEQIVLE